MKKLLLLLAVFTTLVSFAQVQKYSRVEIEMNPGNFKKVIGVGLSLNEGFVKDKTHFVCEYSAQEIKKLSEAGISFDILIDDMSQYYVDRNKNITKNDINRAALINSDVPVPENFNLGSMGGFLTYEEMLAELDYMADNFPEIISVKKTISDINSIEGRPIYYVKISDNPNIDEDEPEILFTGLHHAREPGGMMAVIFYMYHMLENYDTDIEVQNLINNTEIYIAPCVNPDGYLYNEQTNPNGGGAWRKNRRHNDDGSYGVDMNRNYGYRWGYDDEGSSPTPSSETYRGTEAFSEPENQAIKEFCENHEFGIAINYHTYSNLLLYTWGYIVDPCEDNELLGTFAEQMTQVNNYTYGPGSTAIYPSNGGSDDWMYGEQETKGKILAFTPEVGTSSDGFWPSQDRIIPHCQENLLMNILATKFVGKYASVDDDNPVVIMENNGYLNFDFKRIGLKDEGSYTVSVVPVGDAIAEIGDPIEYVNPLSMEVFNDSIYYSLADYVLSGDSIQFAFAIDNGDFIEYDTITKIFGVSQVVFVDDIAVADNWESDVWGITTEYFTSSPASMTDSPFGDYSSNVNNSITLTEAVDLSSAVYAFLSFNAKWRTEVGYDYVQTQISTDGNNWTAIEGDYTQIGNHYQAMGEPLYNGIQDEWVTERMSLHNYIGQQIFIRFVLVSDANTEEDGFYFDDISIETINELHTEIENPSAKEKKLKVFPNPANNIIFITGSGEFRIYNTTGQIVAKGIASLNKKSIDISKLQAGIYYINCNDEDFSKSLKLIVY